MAPTATEEQDVKAFAREVAREGESLVNKIQAFFDALDRTTYEQNPTIEAVLEFQTDLDDTWRMLKGSIPD